MFDDHDDDPAYPVAGATGTDRTPAVTMTNLPSTQNPRFTLLAGDICYADPGGSGPPAEDTKPTPARQERRQPLCVGRLPEPDREPPSTPSATRQVTKVPEKITWSQVPYDDYAFIAVDVVPAAPGSVAAVTIRCLADALPGSGQPYSEIDRVTLQRTAGQGAITGAAPPLTRHRH